MLKEWEYQEFKAKPRVNHLRRLLEENGRNIHLCQECNSTNIIQIHHKNGKPKDDRVENLLVLCRRCHMKKHLQRKRIEEIFWTIKNNQSIGFKRLFAITMMDMGITKKRLRDYLHQLEVEKKIQVVDGIIHVVNGCVY